MKAVAKVETTAAKQFTRDEIELIKTQIAKGASDTELKYFLELCRQTGLNPFLRHIYLIERQVWNKSTQRWDTVRVPQVSIDGFRATAEDSDKYAGQVGPHWCGPDGEWHDVWVRDEPPLAARVGVLRHGFTEPLYAVAKYKEYCARNAKGEPREMWAKMPDLMIAKCSEALALRKAFPHKLGGFYAPEEMEQAEAPATVNQGTGIQHVSATVNAEGVVTGVTIQSPGTGYVEQAGQTATTGPVSAEPGKAEMTGQAWRRFAEKMIKIASGGNGFTPEDQAKMSTMMTTVPKMYANMRAKIEEVMAAATPKDVAQANEPTEQQPIPGADPDAYRLWFIDQMSKIDKKKDLTDFLNIQRPLWEKSTPPVYPPDIEDWEELYAAREKELT